MIELSAEAPAKVNLRLKIEGRRDDGYHLLSMINVTVNLCDQVAVRVSDQRGVRISVNGEYDRSHEAALQDPEKNIAAKAAKLFIEEYSITDGIEIMIDKRIPIGGGLAGGSSNAATVLKLLGEHFQKSDLEKLALKVGADVPYLLHGGPAWVGGIGEQVEPMDTDLQDMECALLLFPFGSDTSEAFQLCSELNLASDAECRQPLADGSLQILDLVSNDFEPVVINKFPAIRESLASMRVISGVVAGLSGSGSSLFALPTEGRGFDEAARQALHHLVELGPKLKLVFTKIR